jgi:hypothetical protein
MSHQEESQSTPALLHLPELDDGACSSLGIIPENNLLESCTRLSISLEENGLFKVSETKMIYPQCNREKSRVLNKCFLLIVISQYAIHL